MESSRIIAELCARYGVSLAFGRKLQPLVELACKSEARKQSLLLEMVERSFAEESKRIAREKAGGAPDDWHVLSSVARLLHGWNPPSWFERWNDEPPRPIRS